MPQTESAKKAFRQSLRKQAVNLKVLRKLKVSIKEFKNKPTKNGFDKIQSIIDKSAKKRVIPKNRAARLKSELAKLIQKPKVQRSKQAKVGLDKKNIT